MFLLSANAAQPDSIEVSGSVFDVLTGMELGQVSVSVLTTDSAVLRTAKTIQGIHSSVIQMKGGSYSIYVPRAGSYILKCKKEGYVTSFSPLNIPERKYGRYVFSWTNKDVQMSRKFAKEDVKLSGAIIRASKIKLVMNRDTVIYNADAFQLEKGSMLDDLIRRLPGMKIDIGGKITYHGEFVEELLIDGKSFFRGNPTIALQNLPAYIVNKIKVYRRESDDSYLLKDSSEIERKKRLVLDVNLKKQYRQGWISNAEVAGGSNDRYLTRIFGLRYTNHSRLGLYYNRNNINDLCKPGNYDGEWNPNYNLSSLGSMNIQTGGANLNWNNRNSKLSIYSALIASREKTKDESISTNVNYLEGGNIYVKDHTDNNENNSSVLWNNQLNYSGKKIYLSFSPNISYRETKNDGNIRNGSFSQYPQENSRGAVLDSLFAPIASPQLMDLLISRISNFTHSIRKNFKLDGSADITFRSPLTDNKIMLFLSGNYEHTDDDLFSHYCLQQPKYDLNNFQNKYVLLPFRNYMYQPGLQYIWALNKDFSLLFNYGYEQRYEYNNRQLFRLDSLSGWNNGMHSLGSLPSNRDSLLTTLDIKNSFHTSEREKNHRIGIETHFNIRPIHADLAIRIPFIFQHKQINDNRQQITRKKTRDMKCISPDVSLIKTQINERSTYTAGLHYNYCLSIPDMINFLDITDDSDPLFIKTGNPGLKNIGNHTFSFTFQKDIKKQSRGLNIQGNYSIIRNAVAQSVNYDRLTDIKTIRPENVNGNWNTNLNIYYGFYADSLKHFYLSTATVGEFNNSVDYISEKEKNNGTSYKSVVKNLSIGDNLDASYSFKNIEFGLFVGVKWDHLSSCREDFSTMNTGDFHYGAKVHYTLGSGFSISSDFTIFSRRGYEDQSMNNNNLIWNATVSQSIGKRFVIKCTGFDLCHQLSSTRSQVNAQGRTETWYNVVPSYVLVHLLYRLNLFPKNKI